MLFFNNSDLIMILQDFPMYGYGNLTGVGTQYIVDWVLKFDNYSA